MLLAHDRRDGVLADPPPPLAQLGRDPWCPVAAAVRGVDLRDRRGQLFPPGPPRRRVTVTPLVEPGRADPQRATRGGVRDAVLALLGGDEPGHRYRPIASSTQRATERLSTSRCIRSSAFSFRSRCSSARSSSPSAPAPWLFPSAPPAARPAPPRPARPRHPRVPAGPWPPSYPACPRSPRARGRPERSAFPFRTPAAPPPPQK